MNDRQNGEGIAEGAMNDMPHIKDLLSAGEKQDALGEGGLFAGDSTACSRLTSWVRRSPPRETSQEPNPVACKRSRES